MKAPPEDVDDTSERAASETEEVSTEDSDGETPDDGASTEDVNVRQFAKGVLQSLTHIGQGIEPRSPDSLKCSECDKLIHGSGKSASQRESAKNAPGRDHHLRGISNRFRWEMFRDRERYPFAAKNITKSCPEE